MVFAVSVEVAVAVSTTCPSEAVVILERKAVSAQEWRMVAGLMVQIQIQIHPPARDGFERVRNSVSRSHSRLHSPLALSGLPPRPPWPPQPYRCDKLYHLVSVVQPPTATYEPMFPYLTYYSSSSLVQVPRGDEGSDEKVRWDETHLS